MPSASQTNVSKIQRLVKGVEKRRKKIREN